MTAVANQRGCLESGCFQRDCDWSLEDRIRLVVIASGTSRVSRVRAPIQAQSAPGILLTVSDRID
jgi:hypothetical protein